MYNGTMKLLINVQYSESQKKKERKKTDGVIQISDLYIKEMVVIVFIGL